MAGKASVNITCSRLRRNCRISRPPWRSPARRMRLRGHAAPIMSQVDVLEGRPGHRQARDLAAEARGQVGHQRRRRRALRALPGPVRVRQETVARAGPGCRAAAGVSDREEPAGGDDPDPVGERLRLLQVVRGQHDRRPARRPGPGSAPRTRAGPPGRSRWSARPGRAARAGRRCRAPRRAGASARRTGCACGPAPCRPGRPARSPRRGRRARDRTRAKWCDDLADGQLVELAGALQHDADPVAPAPDGVAVDPGVTRRDRRRAPSPRRRRAGGSPPGSRRWSSCRRRSGPSRAKISPRADLRSSPSTATVSAVRLSQPIDRDRGLAHGRDPTTAAGRAAQREDAKVTESMVAASMPPSRVSPIPPMSRRARSRAVRERAPPPVRPPTAPPGTPASPARAARAPPGDPGAPEGHQAGRDQPAAPGRQRAHQRQQRQRPARQRPAQDRAHGRRRSARRRGPAASGPTRRGAPAARRRHPGPRSSAIRGSASIGGGSGSSPSARTRMPAGPAQLIPEPGRLPVHVEHLGRGGARPAVGGDRVALGPGQLPGGLGGAVLVGLLGVRQVRVPPPGDVGQRAHHQLVVAVTCGHCSPRTG